MINTLRSWQVVVAISMLSPGFDGGGMKETRLDKSLPIELPRTSHDSIYHPSNP